MLPLVLGSFFVMGLSQSPGQSVSCLFVLKASHKQGLNIFFFHLYDLDAIARRMGDILLKALFMGIKKGLGNTKDGVLSDLLLRKGWFMFKNFNQQWKNKVVKVSSWSLLFKGQFWHKHN